MAVQHEEFFACLLDGGVLYYSLGADPVVELIQAVYDHHSSQARRILRGRIFSTAPWSESAHAMVKIAAKRVSFSIPKEDRALHESRARELRELRAEVPPRLLGESDLPPDAREYLAANRPMAAAFALAEEIPSRTERYDSDRKVAALLLDSQGRLIAAAKNANAKNRTRHAELNLIQGLLAERGQSLPPGARLYVTLKCCKMCAGTIADHAEDIRTNHVFYGADDPGPGARATFLDRTPGLQSFFPSENF